jgi:hypothetical protein
LGGLEAAMTKIFDGYFVECCNLIPFIRRPNQLIFQDTGVNGFHPKKRQIRISRWWSMMLKILKSYQNICDTLGIPNQ